MDETVGLGDDCPTSTCFLCVYSDVACDLPSVSGQLLAVHVPSRRDAAPSILLLADDGTETVVTLPDHTKDIARRLAALPGERLQSLHVHVLHVLRSLSPNGQPDAPRSTRRYLRTTPASALVIEPDLLLNITDINNAEYCVRQYPLRRMVPSPPTAATLRGTILHQAFKEILKGGKTMRGDELEQALQSHTTDLALRQLASADVIADAEPHMEALWNWYNGQRQSLWGDTPHVRAETFLLAPEVGLKGRLDFLMRDGRGDALLELKTGQAADTSRLPKQEHRWQVNGYQTLLAARRPHHAEGLGATVLYSGAPGEAVGRGIPFVLRDLHHVLDLRNQLALVHATGIVPPPPGAKKCARCSLRTDCLRASTLLEWEPPENDEPLEPIEPAAAEWFAHTYELLRLEARAAEEQEKTLWQLSARERLDAGIALGGLTLLGEPEITSTGEWHYTFACENTSELREGDAILLSDGDPVRGAVVSGSILQLDQHGVKVWTPERIANPALIDRYGSDLVHARTVRNLWRWLAVEPRLRALVAGEREPTFDPVLPLDDPPAQLNNEQQSAIARALAARDFLLVQGPPGTGKTSVVAEIARRAMARGERVLVAAFTNQAVDNVLLRLIEQDVHDVVRLGHALSVAPALHPYRLAGRAQTKATADGAPVAARAAERAVDPAQLRTALGSARLVATTTATWSAERYDDAGEPLQFDLAIIDEASQLTVPALLGALRFARRFVLVGDERQLPPLVVSEEAAARGLKRSLFAHLLERWGDVAGVALCQQYRMHPAICAFPSVAFYDGNLVSAGAATTSTLPIPSRPRHPLWPVLQPERPLVFVDVPAERNGEPAGKTSAAQADVVRKIVRALLDAGIAPQEIGVIAPYRAQVAAIRQRVECLTADDASRITVDTVDRFQGGERRVVVFSFGGRVVERPMARGVEFLADPNRLNVALTRARQKLILVGERQWLERVPLLQRLIAHCEGLYGGRGGIVTARPAASTGADE